MSRICIFALLLILGIAVRFGDCNTFSKEDVDCSTESAPGSDKTSLTSFEEIVTTMELPLDILENLIRGKKNTTTKAPSEESGSEGNSSSMTFPGTKWCGSGDNAKDEDDLGRYNETDSCCRAHDNCENFISAGNTEVNLKNNGLFTRSAFICDDALRSCLKDVDSPLSRSLGETYFSMLRPQCFECVCPTDDCQLNDDTECKGQCTKYQWKDNPKF